MNVVLILIIIGLLIVQASFLMSIYGVVNNLSHPYWSYRRREYKPLTYEEYLKDPKDNERGAKTNENFNPETSYPYEKGISIMTKKQETEEKKLISDLITKMIVAKANTDSMANVIKYSLVVMRSIKYKLNWEKAKSDLKIKSYQNVYL